MKKTFIFLTGIISILITFEANAVNLKVGDEFAYRKTEYENSETKNEAGKNLHSNEFITTVDFNFKVLEELKDGYKISVFREELNLYSRDKNGADGDWQTGRTYDKTLRNKHTLYSPDDYKIECILSKQGEISQVEILVSTTKVNHFNQFGIPLDKDSVLIERFSRDMADLFLKLPEKIKEGQPVEFGNEEMWVEKIIDKYVYLVNSKDEKEPRDQIRQYVFDLNTGKILEINSLESNIIPNFQSTTFLKGENTGYTGERNLFKRKRIHLISTNNEPFTCKYVKNGKLEDTVFTKTNVTIRGKIINSPERRKITIFSNEILPGGYIVNHIIVDIQKDNTFEIRLSVDRFQKFSISIDNSIPVYLSPGDDIYFTVDMNDMANTFNVTGVGSHKINYYVKKYYDEKAEKSSKLDLELQAESMYADSSPEEFKNYFLNILDRKQNYLNDHRKWLSPEAYLAEFWKTQTDIVDIIYEYSRNNSVGTKSVDKDGNIIETDNYFDSEFYSLIHPDNDMMAYMEDYGLFIREYVFFLLKSKMAEHIGKGHIVMVDNFYEQLYNSQFGFSESFFSGVTLHVLKYETMVDALYQASWDVFADLYNRFKTEYPNAYRTQLLDVAYKKAEKVAPGQPAYDFKLSDVEGNTVRLSDFKGKVVYIQFIYSWGANSERLKGYDKQLHETFDAKDFVFLYVIFEPDETQVKNYLKGFQGVKLIANHSEDKMITEKYFFEGPPKNIIIDKYGRMFNHKAPDTRTLMIDNSGLLEALEPE